MKAGRRLPPATLWHICLYGNQALLFKVANFLNIHSEQSAMAGDTMRADSDVAIVDAVLFRAHHSCS